MNETLCLQCVIVCPPVRLKKAFNKTMHVYLCVCSSAWRRVCLCVLWKRTAGFCLLCSPGVWIDLSRQTWKAWRVGGWGRQEEAETQEKEIKGSFQYKPVFISDLLLADRFFPQEAYSLSGSLPSLGCFKSCSSQLMICGGNKILQLLPYKMKRINELIKTLFLSKNNLDHILKV